MVNRAFSLVYLLHGLWTHCFKQCIGLGSLSSRWSIGCIPFIPMSDPVQLFVLFYSRKSGLDLCVLLYLDLPSTCPVFLSYEWKMVGLIDFNDLGHASMSYYISLLLLRCKYGFPMYLLLPVTSRTLFIQVGRYKLVMEITSQMWYRRIEKRKNKQYPTTPFQREAHLEMVALIFKNSLVPDDKMSVADQHCGDNMA